MTPLAGLYRATVLKNDDPAGRTRLLVTAPGVLAAPSAWCEACVATRGQTVPPVGSTVWLQFEAGDPGRPVWIGVRP